MAIVIMGHAFLNRVASNQVMQKGSNFVAGALRVPLQFVWPLQRLSKVTGFARQGFGVAHRHKHWITTPAVGDHRERPK